MRPVKPRSPNTLHNAIAKGAEQIGLARFAEVIGRRQGWVRDASDPERSPLRKVALLEEGVTSDKAARLLYEDVRDLSGAGCTSFAEDLALLAGGVFVPIHADSDMAAIHAAAATLSKEGGEAVAAMIQGLLDGKWCAADSRKAQPEVLDLLRAAATAYAFCIASDGDRP